MSEKEKEILETIAEALPEMSDMKKGELLGYGKAMVDKKKVKTIKDKKGILKMNKTSIKKKLSQETGTGFINANQLKKVMGWGNDRTRATLKNLDFIRLNKTKQYDVDEVATVIAESIERVSVQ